MLKRVKGYLLLVFQAIFYTKWCLAAATTPSPPFRSGQTVGSIQARDIEEASGLAASWRNESILWTHQDAGDGPNLYAISTIGDYLGAFKLQQGVDHRDWEDMAVGPGPEKDVSYLYLGDIGNNNPRKPSRETLVVYRLKEPDELPHNASILEPLTSRVDTITLTYPTGTADYADCETLLIDPILGELYVLQKQGGRITNIYATPPNTIFNPQSTIALTLEHRGIIPGVGWVTGGDISRDGQEIILKRSDRVFYFRRPNNHTTISQTLINLEGYQELPYEEEIQGEAMAFAYDLSGYYTLSEARRYSTIPLLFYKRNGGPTPTSPPPTIGTMEEPLTTNSGNDRSSPSIKSTPSPTIFDVAEAVEPTTAPSKHIIPQDYPVPSPSQVPAQVPIQRGDSYSTVSNINVETVEPTTAPSQQVILPNLVVQAPVQSAASYAEESNSASVGGTHQDGLKKTKDTSSDPTPMRILVITAAVVLFFAILVAVLATFHHKLFLRRIIFVSCCLQSSKGVQKQAEMVNWEIVV